MHRKASDVAAATVAATSSSSRLQESSGSKSSISISGSAYLGEEGERKHLTHLSAAAEAGKRRPIDECRFVHRSAKSPMTTRISRILGCGLKWTERLEGQPYYHRASSGASVGMVSAANADDTHAVSDLESY